MLKLVLNIKTFLLLCFPYVAVKCIFRLLQDIVKLGDFNKSIAEQFVCLFDPAKNKKVNKHFKIRHQFQNSTTRPNDMIHTLIKENFDENLRL